ncbi:hypothetical protein PT2222_70133 [Paraburkholderia tropica]
MSRCEKGAALTYAAPFYCVDASLLRTYRGLVASLSAPAQHQRIEPLRDAQQTRARGLGHARQRRAHGVRGDHAAGLHQHLRGRDAALAILVIDERQPALIRVLGGLDLTGGPRVHDLADAVRIATARHRAGRARFEIGDQRDRFFAVPRTDDRVAAHAYQLAQFRRRLRHFDLEVAHVLQFVREAREKRHGERGAAHRRILDHHRNRDGLGDRAEEAVDRSLARAQRRAVIRRHDHHHSGARILRGAAAFGAHARAEMRGRDDHGHAARDVFEHAAHDGFAFGVGQRKLLGEVREDAQAVRARVDHEVGAAALAVEVEIAVLREDGRHDRENAAIRSRGCHGHR